MGIKLRKTPMNGEENHSEVAVNLAAQMLN
jgi:hypothetical protein